MTVLELQDSIPLGELHMEQDEIFKVLKTGERPYEFYDNTHLSIAFEMNLDRKVIKRIVYTYLDWLGDVGGLNGALGGSFLVILAVL